MRTTHEEKIDRIVADLKSRPRSAALRFRKGTVSHKVPKHGNRIPKVFDLDVSDLDSILEIDEGSLTCTAEPGVTFADLVRQTLALGLAPVTVPELKTITLGGAVAGCSVESMSYKYGGFHDSCLEYEVVTASGEVLECARDGENALVFDMAHGTFGTLGLITKLKFRLLPARPYVRLVYEKHDDYGECMAALRERMDRGDIDFIDGLALSEREFVLCLGSFVDRAPYTHSYDRMGVYYRAAATLREDYLCTFDYFFRYDADCHWIARNYGLEIPLLRFVFGRLFLSSTRMLSLAHAITRIKKARRPDVIVDLFVPIAKVESFWDFYRRTFDYYPLWLVPYKIAKVYPWISPSYIPVDSGKLYIDFAIYGYRPKDSRNYYRILEEELEELGGIKTLISHNFHGRDEFWRIMNKPCYDEVKRIVDPDNAFRDLYEKTHGG
jgi:FAD/FMN-containing dehydrogenase